MIFVIGLLIFYIIESFVVSDVIVSLFIFIFEKVGVVFVVFVMNVVILMVVLFVGNFGMYVLICMFWDLVC